ncbi:hypothetical protein DPMN_067042 [Dreissena polymorpha]|uniref:G-protein coupled receptors family 1 profile domain-containing protein n=1 Tax=Dreissena polymorpha TaxID=45954 RepID=A0A9D3YWL7_DREPO|nr:hypothetical protein DPMN_067042 [Dreissena polymorpha]
MPCDGEEFGHSYFCLPMGDHEKSYFTFFSEYNRLGHGAAIFEAIVLNVIFCLSLLVNLIVLWYMWRSKMRKTVTNYFVLNLVVADIAFVITAPLTAYIRLQATWTLGQGMCSFVVYWVLVCGTVTIWLMTAISIDRYTNVTHVTSFPARVRLWKVFGISFAIWTICVLSFLPVGVFFRVRDTRFENSSVKFCTLIWPDTNHVSSMVFTVLVSVVCFIFPVAIISTNYYRIYRKYSESKRAVENFNSDNRMRSQQLDSRHQRNKKVIRALIVLVMAFIVMWLPVFIVLGVIEYDVSHGHNRIPSSAIIWATALAYLNTLVNAFIYGSMFIDLRRMRLFCRKWIPGRDRNKIAVSPATHVIDTTISVCN